LLSGLTAAAFIIFFAVILFVQYASDQIARSQAKKEGIGVTGEPARAAESSGEWSVTLSGVGPVRVGTTRKELEAATVSQLTKASNLQHGAEVFELSGLEDVAVAIAADRVKAVSITGTWKTRSGLEVGDPESQILRLYGDKVVVSQSGQAEGPVFEFVPRDEKEAHLRVIFATSDGRVSAICAGELPEVAELCGASGAAVSTNLQVGDLVETGMVSGCGCVVHPPLTDGQAARDRVLFFSDAACRAWLNVDGRDVMLEAEEGRADGGPSVQEADCARSSEYGGDGLAVHLDRKEVADCPPFSTECKTTTYDVTITVRRNGLRETVKGRGGCEC